jgi:hypothetical protein
MNRDDMDDLIDRAEREGKWLHTCYQDIWFKPSELRRARAEGRFLWGVPNWTLRDPRERLAEAEQAAQAAVAHRDRVAREVFA